ncbi:MAG: serine/threonine-protein kinase [Acidobacteriota bacterium]|nr:serine/threonine-protein kinase [Acidobacteriota bacterium]
MEDETHVGGDAGQNGSDEPAGQADETVSFGSAAHGPAEAGLPSSIGPYRILGKLGEGGMGVVFEAEQQNPRRKVALKVVRGGQFVDETQVRMFQREADSLARLKHPNIAAIYESGRTEGGQHFFAMEIVRGEPLDEWGASPKGTVADLRLRLALFRKIADAVNYAHQRGVIHRDLKPSNIVVTSNGESPPGRQSPPEIKILDFGLARITDTDVAAASMVTEVGMIKGTLPYMSPEQARGDPGAIDLRTDVYSLGVILYEMICGSRPYDTNTSSLVEAVRVICETQPKSLSHSWSGTRKLDGDIETIVGKALEKDADRRYASAAALSEDIERYLTSQPILARPPSATYQLRKFAKRNKTLVGGVVATMLMLIAGMVVSTVFGLREAAQRREAEQARSDLESVVEFQAGMLSATDPEKMGRRLMENLSERVARNYRGGGISEQQVASAVATHESLVGGVNSTDLALDMIDEDILAAAVRTLDEKFGDQPKTDARLRQTIGETYRKLGRLERSEPQLVMALETRKRVLGDEHPETLSSINNLASLYQNQGRYAEAEPLYLTNIEAQKRVLGDDHLQTLSSMNNLAILYKNQGRLDEAEPLSLKTLESRKRVLGDDHPHTIASMSNLGNLYRGQGRYAEAEPLYIQALETRKRVFGDDDPGTLDSMNNLASLYWSQGRYAEAEPLFFEALEVRRRVLGDDHPDTLNSMNNLASLYLIGGRYAEAEPLYLEALETRKRVLGDDHPHTLDTMNNLAVMYKNQGRYHDSEPLNFETLEARRRVLGDDHPDTLSSMTNLAVLHKIQGRYDDAESLGLEALETRKRVHGDDHPATLSSMINLADLYSMQGRYDEAESLYLESLRSSERVLGDDHLNTLVTKNNLAALYRKQGRHAEAEALSLDTVEAMKRVLGDDHPATLSSEYNLALVYSQQGRYADAKPLYLELLATQKRVLGDDHPNTVATLYDLAGLEAVRGDRAEAMDRLREAVDAGYAKSDSISKDTDLESLHGPEFDALVERVRQSAVEQQAE